MSKPADFALVPVMAEGRCADHLLRTAKGFRAFDQEDKPIGVFTDVGAATKALLELANGGLA